MEKLLNEKTAVIASREQEIKNLTRDYTHSKKRMQKHIEKSFQQKITDLMSQKKS